jgi:PAS domain S-box-containing protein
VARLTDEPFRSVLDATAEAIVTIDSNGIVETFNAGAQRMFGYAADEVVSRNVSMLDICTATRRRASRE